MDTCTHDDGKTTTFCGLCGKVRVPGSLARIADRIQPRFTGAANISSPAIERFWATGDIENNPGL